MQSCCVISYYQLLTKYVIVIWQPTICHNAIYSETQQRILTQDIWNTCGITAPSKCTNSLVIFKYITFNYTITVLLHATVYDDDMIYWVNHSAVS